MRRKRRWNPNRPLLWSLVGCCAVIGLYLSLTLVVRGSMAPGYRLLAGAIDVLTFGWLFAIGAAIGSFLNVIAWRLPRGRSIGGRSHCPYCTSAIQARDNFPVFGWILLRGRCRQCRLPISVRYPLVELLVGMTLAPVGMAVLLRGRAYRPLEAPLGNRNWPLNLAELDWHDLGAVVYLYAALAGLWAMALVRFDAFRLPRKLVLAVIAIVASGPLLAPALQPIPWQLRIPEVPGLANSPIRWLGAETLRPVWHGTDRGNALMFLLCASAIGIFLGRLAGRFLFAQADFKRDPLGQDTSRLLDWSMGLALTGALIGWQGLIGVFPLVLMLSGFLWRSFPDRDRAGLCLMALPPSIALVILAWPWLGNQPWWPSAGHWGALYPIYGGASWLMAATVSLFNPPPPRMPVIPVERSEADAAKSEESESAAAVVDSLGVNSDDHPGDS